MPMDLKHLTSAYRVSCVIQCHFIGLFDGKQSMQNALQGKSAAVWWLTASATDDSSCTEVAVACS